MRADSQLRCNTKLAVTYLQVIHGTGDGPLSDLVAIGVQDRNDGTTLCRVDVLDVSRDLRGAG